MLAEICDRCEAVEECYEFLLAYAAQGLPSDQGSKSGGQVREFLHRAVEALKGLSEACALAVKQEGLEPEGKYLAFIAVLDRDSRDSLAAIEMVLAQPAISSQLIDNLNASIHVRALLTDLFLLGAHLCPRRHRPGGQSAGAEAARLRLRPQDHAGVGGVEVWGRMESCAAVGYRRCAAPMRQLADWQSAAD